MTKNWLNLIIFESYQEFFKQHLVGFNLYHFMRSIVLLFFFISSTSIGQTVCLEESKVRLDSIQTALSRLESSQKTMNELTAEIGKWFLNTPYVEKTLEIEGEEKLVINVTGLDCTTYLETVVTLARLAKQNEYSFEDYEKELEFLRYRDGKLNEYPSRLHYFSDWIFNNQKKGIIKDITREIGGEIYDNHPSFMSENPGFYLQLSKTEFVDQIKITEAEIKTRSYYYLPKDSLYSYEYKIKSGDIIAITISMDNLDISHVGFAFEKNGRIHLLHASSKSKKVVISEKPLVDYLMGNKSQSGVMVCRPINPD
jgi:hypothetical protein